LALPLLQRKHNKAFCFSSALFHKGMILGKIIAGKMCVLIFSTTLSKTMLRQNQGDITINVLRF
jgi:hypothetical protein